jgi:hypothetical protein
MPNCCGRSSNRAWKEVNSLPTARWFARRPTPLYLIRIWSRRRCKLSVVRRTIDTRCGANEMKTFGQGEKCVGRG